MHNPRLKPRLKPTPFNIKLQFPKGLRGLIFDCDGVLLDSKDTNCQYYNALRKGVGLPPMTPEECDFVHQATVKGAFERLFPAHYAEAALEVAKGLDYNKEILPMLTLEDGLLEALHWFQHHGVRLAVSTNRTDSIHEVLHYFGLESFFKPVMCAGNTTPKPSPDGLLAIMGAWDLPAAQVAFIGDSPVDQQAAEAAGVPFWAFANTTLQSRFYASDFHDLMHQLEFLVEKK